ncbi:endonuclease/exonuclease/phosphatase family protein [Rhodopirellula sp. MGV]|uniref:endonuclease/exonuclease/phosphatase family protein n=1 Tax=Rhodopirellula sp. MGV TaxID=2023130 RepID=UPI0013041A02|nr:endonuclease/exonuclease/phosphatase family protein [Rhodopirellula sp. MGV]
MQIGRLLTIAVIVVSIVSLPATRFWLSDLLANLRLQVILAASFALLWTAAARTWRQSILIAICLLWHLTFVVPHVWNATRPQTVQDGPARLKVMTLNALTRNPRHEAIIAQIREFDADVVAVLELSSSLASKLSERLTEEYPHQVLHPMDDGNFGIGLISRRKLDQVEIFELNRPIKSIQVSCDGFRLIATHPLPPMGAQLFRSRNEHLQQLSEHVIESETGDSAGTIVMGDFNLTPWSPVFHQFGNDCGLRRAVLGSSLTPTWYAKLDWFPFGLTLDHVWISPQLECIRYQIGRDVGSDHRAVVVSLAKRSASTTKDAALKSPLGAK